MYSSVVKRLLHTSVRDLQKYVYAMNKAYLRHHRSTDGEKFDITFQLVDPAHQVNRNFNFTRNLNENVAAFLSRVNTNVEKIYAKACKKKKLLANQAPPIDAGLYINHVKIADDVPCNQVFQESNNITLKLCDREFSVVINAPFVESIALPSSILATFPVYPQKFESQFVDEEYSVFTWYKSSDKLKWEKIGNGFMFTPSVDTVQHYLKLECLPRNARQAFNEGPIIEVISDGVVQPSPGACPFLRRQENTKFRCKNEEFRVVSYNILADLYCDSDYTRNVLHPYCPPHALSLDYRKQLFIKEILGYNSDIICLQEVDRKVYNYDLAPILSRYGYSSDFALKGGQVAEGLTCFYHKDKFKVISSEKVHLAESLQSNWIFKDFLSAVSVNDKLMTRFLERQTVLQLITLECLYTGNILFVANTHLYFHPDADHIRLLQGAMGIKYIEEQYKQFKNDLLYRNKKIGIMFCGDFNSVPECGIYKLFTKGQVESDCIDWSSNQQEMVKDLSITQPFALSSACGTPQYTNYTSGFADCLDYIFYDTNAVEVMRSVPLPTNDELIFNTALPSVVFPSDHISLCADFKWRR